MFSSSLYITELYTDATWLLRLTEPDVLDEVATSLLYGNFATRVHFCPDRPGNIPGKDRIRYGLGAFIKWHGVQEHLSLQCVIIKTFFTSGGTNEYHSFIKLYKQYSSFYVTLYKTDQELETFKLLIKQLFDRPFKH